MHLVNNQIQNHFKESTFYYTRLDSSVIMCQARMVDCKVCYEYFPYEDFTDAFHVNCIWTGVIFRFPWNGSISQRKFLEKNYLILCLCIIRKPYQDHHARTVLSTNWKFVKYQLLKFRVNKYTAQKVRRAYSYKEIVKICLYSNCSCFKTTRCIKIRHKLWITHNFII